ncbi:hypothetical protein EA472_03335 [Natrarchaeobius oligotrophus]|uniref:Uncharacterized protein n=1 Tax=Natrarchaeobius chitinivorans TaxID=1679083 RepID=A0A3N6MH09_NATCH|nr:hypothetical protein EA472_03335 [Natrarchaeobius chitinivorans]
MTAGEPAVVSPLERGSTGELGSRASTPNLAVDRRRLVSTPRPADSRLRGVRSSARGRHAENGRTRGHPMIDVDLAAGGVR